MEIETLRDMTVQVFGRTMNPAIEAHLPQYAKELETLLDAARAVSREFSADLPPAGIFSPAAGNGGSVEE